MLNRDKTKESSRSAFLSGQGLPCGRLWLINGEDSQCHKNVHLLLDDDLIFYEEL